MNAANFSILKTPTTGSSEMLAGKAEEIIEYVLNELSALTRLINTTPQNYSGFQDVASAIRTCIEELEDGEEIIRSVGDVLERRDRIDG